MMQRYEAILYWSDEDGVFVAEVPELPGCMAHGKTTEKALKNVNEAIELWIRRKNLENKGYFEEVRNLVERFES